MTPPPLLQWTGDWETYDRTLYQVFMQDLTGGILEYSGRKVFPRRHAEVNNKWAGYWHLIQEGPIEEERTPDFRRCERLPWIRWVIENALTHSEIDVWENKRPGGERSTLLWYREEYLVVLSVRGQAWLLKSAYCTTQSGRIRQLAKERDIWLSQHQVP